MGEKNGQVSNLLEDGWFFGNTLLSRSNSSKTMVRCNSDPCSSSSTTKEETLGSQDTMSSLFRTPSLPPCWGRDRKYGLDDEDEDEDEDDEPRMADLIRQAMPMPAPPPMSRRRLERTPSLPPCRVKEGSSTIVASNGEHGDSNAWLKKKGGPIAAVSTLTRRASIDSSMLLPPKCTTSKGCSRLSTSNTKNRSHRKQEPPSITTPEKTGTKLEKLEKMKPQKSLGGLEVEELQGFKDLGFSFDNKKDISSNVTNVLPALQRRASIDSSQVDIAKVRRPYLSESWQKSSSSSSSSSSPSSAPQVPNKWADPKAALSDDMKAQLKFWARAVASNVRQEC